MAWASAANVVWSAWGVLGPVIADRELGGAAAWGVVIAAMGVGTLIGAVAAIRGALRRPMLAIAITGFVNACRSRCSPSACRWRCCASARSPPASG